MVGTTPNYGLAMIGVLALMWVVAYTERNVSKAFRKFLKDRKKTRKMRRKELKILNG